MPPEQNNPGDDSDLQLPPNTTKTGKEGSKEWNDAEKKIKEGRGKGIKVETGFQEEAE